MQTVTGVHSFQQSWNRIWNQATDLGQAVSERFHAISETHHRPAQDHWHGSMPQAKTSPAVLPLLKEENESPKITANSRVLIIGDSQTVGPYGKKLDDLARGTGAAVVTHASWGASPDWFMTGQATNYKYWTRDTEGQAQDLRKVETPLLQDLLTKEKPDVVIVTMGGNMIASNASQANVTQQVSQIGNAVSASGAELVWVGPPKYDPQKRSAEVLEGFYQKLENIVPEFGTLIDSRAHIKEYSGSDGLHYTGPEGERVAQQWATGVFEEIQDLKK